MPSAGHSVILRDSTLREGLDTPTVAFTGPQKLRIAAALVAAGVAEAEVVAPSRVDEDLGFVRALKRRRLRLRASGLVYANDSRCGRELDECGTCLDRVDLLMPLSEQRRPHAPHDKISCLLAALAHPVAGCLEVGVGFPHAMQADPELVLEIGRRAVAAGAKRITLYDTNGGADPFTVHALIGRLASQLDVPLFFHAHDDLGLATANAWAAVRAGSAGLDVTVNGLGDRAGNASLEQLATLLRVRGFVTGVGLTELPKLSRLVARLSGIVVSPLAPVVGAYAFAHRSPSHLPVPTEFEAFDPELLGTSRRLEDPRRRTRGRFLRPSRERRLRGNR